MNSGDISDSFQKIAIIEDGHFVHKMYVTREYIAAMAMQGLLSNNVTSGKRVIELSVQFADDLLKELAKNETTKQD